MIDHVSVGVSDLENSAHFYEATPRSAPAVARTERREFGRMSA